MRASILDKELHKIITAGAKYKMVCIHEVKALHVPEDKLRNKPKENIRPIVTQYVDVHRSYNMNLVDIVNISMSLHKGDYVKNILPYKDDLTITLVSTVNGVRLLERYKFIINVKGYDTESEVNHDRTLHDLNADGIVTITGQCINQAMDKNRLKHVQGLYTNCTVEALMSKLMSDTIGNYSNDGGLLKRTVKIIPVDNERVYKNISIPEGIFINSLPSFLQDTNYGVYNGGLGTYTQRYPGEEITFVYPLYNSNKEDRKIALTVFEYKLAEIGISETTYVVEDKPKLKNIKIIGSLIEDGKPIDETSIKTIGTGFQGIESDTIMNRSAIIKKDKIEINPKRYTRTMSHRTLLDGSKDVGSVGISNNFYKQRSKVLQQDGNHITVRWMKSHADLLEPGMFVTYVKEVDGKLNKYAGILHGVTKMTDNDSKTESSVLLIFIGN